MQNEWVNWNEWSFVSLLCSTVCLAISDLHKHFSHVEVTLVQWHHLYQFVVFCCKAVVRASQWTFFVFDLSIFCLIEFEAEGANWLTHSSVSRIVKLPCALWTAAKSSVFVGFLRIGSHQMEWLWPFNSTVKVVCATSRHFVMQMATVVSNFFFFQRE